MIIIFLLVTSRNQFRTSSIEKIRSSLQKRATFFKSNVRSKKLHLVLELDQSKKLNPYIEFNTQKIIEAEKNADKDGKAFYKLINNAAFDKTMENVRNRVEVKLVKNKINYLKTKSKPIYVAEKIFDNGLIAIHKIKTTSTYIKPAYIKMCILKLSKLPMY